MAERIHSRQLEAVVRRLEALEAALGKGPHEPNAPARGRNAGVVCSSHFGLGSCNLPIVPERPLGPNVSSHRESLIRYIEKKWVNGTKLRYYLFQAGPWRGEASNLELVRQAFDVWEDVGIGIEFEEVDNINEAHIRIGFLRGDGSWSYVGRDVIDIPGRNERTMNFGWDLTLDPRGGGLDTPVHEIGHTLGFPHEHQNPFSGIVWDEEAVYTEFGGPPNNWPRDQVFHNILRKLSRNEVEGSAWDPNSVMHYGFGPGLIKEPAQFRSGLNPAGGLSETDKAEARKFYPPLDRRTYRKLIPFETQMLNIGPGEQLDFVIEPDRSDDYTIQTVGRSDTLMVLFEEVNGELESIGADDDSGTDLNARIQARLIRGRKYILRIRLYLNWASGESAVLLS